MYVCTQMAEQLIAEGCIYEGELLNMNWDQARKDIGLSLQVNWGLHK